MDSFIWLGLSLFLILLESVTLSLVCIWFAVGSGLTMLVAVCGCHNLVIQLAVFILSSSIFLLLLGPLYKKVIWEKKEERRGKEEGDIVGNSSIVTQEIGKFDSGEIYIGGKFWSAKSSAGNAIPENTPVIVDRVTGVTAYVTPIVQETEK